MDIIVLLVTLFGENLNDRKIIQKNVNKGRSLMERFKLCYIDRDWAYFTSQDLDKQWGDDWDDIPYQYNAGTPYNYNEKTDKEPYKIIKVAFVSEHYRPCDFSEGYSVKGINNKEIAWLCRPNWWENKFGELIEIFAGEDYEIFIEKIKKSGGEIYAKLD